MANIEYIFHCKPTHPRAHKRPMSTTKLRGWYEAMLARAVELGIATQVDSLHEHTEEMSSVREFPLFEGDFFPARLKELIQAQAPSTRGSAAATKAPRMPQVPEAPALSKRKSAEMAEVVRKEVKSHRQRFLVATLNVGATQPKRPPPRRRGTKKPAGPEVGGGGGGGGEDASGSGASELLDSRTRFLELCTSRHWQFDELGRAQWATLMMLATLGGAPRKS